jgi:hypothetical protein
MCVVSLLFVVYTCTSIFICGTSCLRSAGYFKTGTSILLQPTRRVFHSTAIQPSSRVRISNYKVIINIRLFTPSRRHPDPVPGHRELSLPMSKRFGPARTRSPPPLEIGGGMMYSSNDSPGRSEGPTSLATLAPKLHATSRVSGIARRGQRPWETPSSVRHPSPSYPPREKWGLSPSTMSDLWQPPRSWWYWARPTPRGQARPPRWSPGRCGGETRPQSMFQHHDSSPW